MTAITSTVEGTKAVAVAETLKSEIWLTTSLHERPGLRAQSADVAAAFPGHPCATASQSFSVARTESVAAGLRD
jgi:hypothetical protein